MKVAIVGCGSLGGTLAVKLAGAPGIELCVLNRNPQIAEAAARHGLRLESPGRRPRTARPPLSASLPPNITPLDAVILATKSVGLREVCASLLPALAPEGFFVTTQNGLVGLELAEMLGPRRVIPGTVLWGASMLRPGVYRLTASGGFVLGDLHGSNENPVLRAAAGLLARAFPVRVSANIRGVLWSKLVFTASFTSLGALSGLRFGPLALRPEVRRAALAIGAEVRAAAGAQGIRLEPLVGGLDLRRLLEPGGYPALLRHLYLLALGWKNRRTESSMLDSLRRGRPTEIDFINGMIAELGERQGFPAPWNRGLRELIGELEGGRQAPHPANLRRLAGRAAALAASEGGSHAR